MESPEPVEVDSREGEAEVARYITRRCFALLAIMTSPPSPAIKDAHAPLPLEHLSEATSFSAREALDQQVEDIGECFDLSLDAIWRAVGSPRDDDPLCWLAWAYPLVPAFDRYYSDLRAMGCDPACEGHHRTVYIREDDREDGCWLPGDLMTTTWFIARAYAYYLDLRRPK